MSDCESVVSEFTEISDEDQYDDETSQLMILCRSPIEEILELCYEVPQRYTVPVQQMELHNKDTGKTYKLYVDRVESDYQLDLKKYDTTVIKHIANLLSLTMRVANVIAKITPIHEYQTGTIYFDYNDKWRLGIIVEES